MVRKVYYTVSQFSWLPMATSIIAGLTSILCYIITIKNGYFSPVFPFITHVTLFPPTSLIFGVGIAIGCIFLTLVTFLRKIDLDYMIDAAFRNDNSLRMYRGDPTIIKRLNFIAMILMLISAVGFIILSQSNIFVPSYSLIHYISTAVTIISALIYFTIVSRIQWHLRYPRLRPRRYFASLSILVFAWMSFTMLLALVPSVTSGFHEFPETKGKGAYEQIMVTYYNPGHPLRYPFLAGAILEWSVFICVLFLIGFISFDLRDSKVRLEE